MAQQNANVEAMFEKLQSEQESLAAALIDREHDVDQHNLVIKTLQAQSGDKKAWRLVGDILVERTVVEVLPEVEQNRDNLMAMVKQYQRQLGEKQREVREFQDKYKIQSSDQAKTSSESKQASSGVLVTS